MSELVKAITDANFEHDVLQSKIPVLVDFWAPWCGPCRMVAPVLDKLAPDYEGKVHIVKYNVDENTEVAGKHGIRSIPTLLLFKDGEVFATKVGAPSEADLRAFIDKAI